jgi:hypothetical protein
LNRLSHRFCRTEAEGLVHIEELRKVVEERN